MKEQQKQALRWATLCLYNSKNWVNSIKESDANYEKLYKKLDDLFIEMESMICPVNPDDKGDCEYCRIRK